MRWRPAVAATIALALVAAACGSDDEPDGAGGSGRLQVVTTVYPVADAVTRVGGDRVAVSNLTPVGVEPHDIEITSRQVDRLEDADLVFYVGSGFQPAVEDVAERLGDRAVDLAERFGGDDPHFWLDPRQLSDAVDEMAKAMAAASPDDAAAFRANATRYRTELASLDRAFEAGLADCDRNEIVTSHAAFSHLARRYDLEQLSIAGLSPEAEPDADRLASLAAQIDAEGITTVFFEELVSPDVAETLARDAGATTAVLSPLEGLSEEQVDAGKDYVAVMRDNLAALRLALGCR
jgi:zinc transport system substrate-binding protein